VYSNIAETKQENIRVYWIKNDTKELFNDVEYIDRDNNGLIDRLEWVVPHLSNQTFEISIIVINPYTYLRDGDTWVVAFNTTGIADLRINSTNANWTEILTDNKTTFDEMTFLDLKCENSSVKDNLFILDINNNYISYNQLSIEDSYKIKQFVLYNYTCNATSYFSNYMHKAGYSNLLFDYGGYFAYAHDPTLTIRLNASSIVADVYSRDDVGNSADYQPQLKWNLSLIPYGATIDKATMCLYLWNCDASCLDNDVTYWRIVDQSWTESITTTEFDAQSKANQTSSTFNGTTLNSYICVDITNIIKSEYDLANTFASVRMEDPDYVHDGTSDEIYYYEHYLFFGGYTGPDKVDYVYSRQGESYGPMPYLEVRYNLSETVTGM